MSSNPKMLKKQESQRQWVENLLVKAQERKYFGTIAIVMKRGMIDIVRYEESVKPPEDKEA